MAYLITDTGCIGNLRNTKLATVETLDEARAYLDTLGTVHAFDLDDDGYDAADAMVEISRFDCRCYTIEAV